MSSAVGRGHGESHRGAEAVGRWAVGVSGWGGGATKACSRSEPWQRTSVQASLENSVTIVLVEGSDGVDQGLCPLGARHQNVPPDGNCPMGGVICVCHHQAGLLHAGSDAPY